LTIGKASYVTQTSNGGAVLAQETVGEDHANEDPVGEGDQAIDSPANREAQTLATIATKHESKHPNLQLVETLVFLALCTPQFAQLVLSAATKSPLSLFAGPQSTVGPILQ
jgi:hypothetical protein